MKRNCFFGEKFNLEVVAIKSFPFSGNDELEFLLKRYTDANFVNLEDAFEKKNVFIKTNVDLIKRDSRLFCVCLVSHPILAFRYWLAAKRTSIPKKHSLEFCLEFNLLCGKSWLDFYSNVKRKNNMLISLEELRLKPKTILFNLSKIIPFLRFKHEKFSRNPNLNLIRKNIHVPPMTELPSWFKEKVELEYRDAYEALGLKW